MGWALVVQQLRLVINVVHATVATVCNLAPKPWSPYL